MEHQNWPTYRSIQFLTCVYNSKTIFSSFEKLNQGFYTDSQILYRSPYEALLKIVYISLHPEVDPYSVISNNYKPGVPKFKITNFIRDELKFDWKDYFLLSASSHGNQYEIANEALKIYKEGQKEAISIKIKFNQMQYEMGLNHLTFIVYAYLKIIRQLFYSSDIEYSAEQSRLLKLMDNYCELRYTSTIESHPKTYWPTVFKDFDKILKYMEKSDSGINWKTNYPRVSASI
jgi:hypothetical protein